MCIKVDLPAPLCPTSPRHSPRPSVRSTPPSARTAPKCFSMPFSLTSSGLATIIRPLRLATRARVPPSLHVGFDRRDRFLLRIFVARDAALLDVGQFGLEIVLR